jgi:hypothetical protein
MDNSAEIDQSNYLIRKELLFMNFNKKSDKFNKRHVKK